MLRLVKLLLVPVIGFFSSRRDLLLENGVHRAFMEN